MIKYHTDSFDVSDLGPNNIDRIQINMIPKGSRVLEIGCATGYMSEYLIKSKNCNVTGVELDPDQAELARKKCNHFIMGGIDDNEVQQKLDQFVLEKGKYDVVFMSQVIEHIANPVGVLMKIHEWIDHTGILVISTCNIAHWKCRLRLLMGKWEYEDAGIFDITHLRFFTTRSFKRLLQNCRYRVIDEGYTVEDFCPFYLFIGRRVLAPSTILRCIPFAGQYLRQKYIYIFRNLISTQFVYKVTTVG